MVLSWGRAHRFEHDITRLRPGNEAQQLKAAFQGNRPVLAHGLGRSYGDVALNEDGTLLVTPAMDQLLAADWKTGLIRVSAGLSSEQLLRICVPKGWFLPVTPGTKFVTMGGAVANDVHGKNHHKKGSFGAHVTRLGLQRSDKGYMELSRDENPDLFALTLGGLGLTGIILWVELQLTPIRSAYLDVENIKCRSLSDFFRLSEESKDWDYTVMWVDCFATGRKLGRGIFSRARFKKDGQLDVHSQKAIRMPFAMPGFILNKLSISIFNWLYRIRPAARFKGKQHYDPFFYPLDGIQDWNLLYGPQGFFQHQCLLAPEKGEEGIREMLERIAKSGQGSFLAVLKVHGPEPSPGVMSFCGEGVSLALDFANKGPSTLQLLSDLDAIVEAHNGRVYPAKDSRMSPEFFQKSYPDWTKLEAARDPKISSSFWRRVTGKNKASSHD